MVVTVQLVGMHRARRGLRALLYSLGGEMQGRLSSPQDEQRRPHSGLIDKAKNSPATP